MRASTHASEHHCELNGDHERTIVGPLRFSGAPNSPLLLLQTSFTSWNLRGKGCGGYSSLGSSNFSIA
ncbi:unnamed protein product [Lactuca virosa]|uniref:Uncharacterized protein n=1 Tax=Lactuca virosa TaxID=75947 RepID=A0AAU9PH99_9ASTR|nr:unnamed protein product [Lactuca virosa]